MSSVASKETGRLANKAAVSACWTQWVCMGSLASPEGSRRARSIIDPEALILLSLYARDEERRLLDMVAWWAQVGSHLTSLQRLRSVAKRFPGDTGEAGLGLFASFATEAGDRRWAKHADSSLRTAHRPGKGSDEPILTDASALWPRLRAAFGVGAKADTLVFLLGLRGALANAKDISYATGYSSVTSRSAAGDMALARLIRETGGRPVAYIAPPRPWAELLDFYPSSQGREAERGAPAWRFWSEVFAFLVGAVEWSRFARAAGQKSPHVVASRARDVLDRHRLSFDLNGIPTPPADAFLGLEAPRGLHETVRVVADWIDDRL